jgi:hypothetical protein
VQRDQIRGKTDFNIHPFKVAEAIQPFGDASMRSLRCPNWMISLGK